jgi:hypothetical protein
MPPIYSSTIPRGSKRQAEDDDGEGSRKRQATEGSRDAGGMGAEQYWMVQWCAASLPLLFGTWLTNDNRRVPQNRKHKTWDGDGVLVVNTGSRRSTLMDQDGKMYARFHRNAIAHNTHTHQLVPRKGGLRGNEGRTAIQRWRQGGGD